jgi:hypothetical protein
MAVNRGGLMKLPKAPDFGVRCLRLSEDAGCIVAEKAATFRRHHPGL